MGALPAQRLSGRRVPAPQPLPPSIRGDAGRCGAMRSPMDTPSSRPGTEEALRKGWWRDMDRSLLEAKGYGG